MNELEKIEYDKQVYTKWLCEDKSKPIRAIHWLWEYLETPHQEDNKLTEDDELDILQSFINYKRANQPQLTIPKSIADEFDQIYEDTEEYQTNVAQMFSSMQSYFVLESYPKILHWLEDDVKNTNVVLAYLAGKALGVDLVKVVEG
ncbi:hypothetical protein [Lactococcus lactis]|uniref:hypothetical protein n=1 Tax=Lactococcus lactis TaxID=1358 RepID=UPI0015D4C552|nr:hypothetical protein [Lactococcus lactis]GFO80082.1 hypothetical protein LL1119B1_21380 [Lactococcus lactis]